MNIVIYDDSFLHRMFIVNSVKEYIDNHIDDITLELFTGDCAEIERYIEQAQMFTLYFIDIVDESGDSTGFELAEFIKEKNSSNEVVFVTRYMRRIVEDTPHKILALNIIPKHRNSCKREIQETIEYVYSKLPNDNYLIINCGYGDIFRVAYDDIYMIESVKGTHKVCIHYRNGTYEFKATLKNIFTKLDDRFKYCHRCYIINTSKIEFMKRAPRSIIFDNGLACSYSITFKLNKELKRDDK